ncbi:hypothetical protein GQ53DRAFT_809615 [Thozetella sp. PMI_491]|nr:hypothetical protein GQ53DRAFT_809615 [Thozetella sp. PMI_491]
MFGGKARDDAAHHLLGNDHAQEEGVSDGMVWEHASSVSERHIAEDSEIWEQDPLHGGDRRGRKEVVDPEPQPPAYQSGRRTRRMPSEDHGEATAELDEEFQKIFKPVKKDQDEKARFHRDLDAACAAYSARLEEMQERQREREGTIERPWLIARRRREWERFMTTLKGFGTLATCFWGGTVGSLEQLPPQVPWPPPHLTRMKEDHANERKALSDAHLAVVEDLRKKYMFELSEDGEAQVPHICIERRLLIEVSGDIPIPTDDIGD